MTRVRSAQFRSRCANARECVSCMPDGRGRWTRESSGERFHSFDPQTLQFQTLADGNYFRLSRKNQRFTTRNFPFEIRASAHDRSIERIEISLAASGTVDDSRFESKARLNGRGSALRNSAREHASVRVSRLRNRVESTPDVYRTIACRVHVQRKKEKRKRG